MSEREAFEQWYRAGYGGTAFLSRLHAEPNGRDAALAWSAWRARASKADGGEKHGDLKRGLGDFRCTKCGHYHYDDEVECSVPDAVVKS